LSDDHPESRTEQLRCAGDDGTKQLAADADPAQQQTFCRRQIAYNRGAMSQGGLGACIETSLDERGQTAASFLEGGTYVRREFLSTIVGR